MTSSAPAVAAGDVLTLEGSVTSAAPRPCAASPLSSEHHLLVFVPRWKLRSAHALLLGKGYGPRMEFAASYGDVLSRATRARAGSPI